MKIGFKRTFVLASFVLLLFLSVGFVFGDWSEEFVEGDWSVCNRDGWSGVLGEDDGWAVWNNTVANFTGYYGKVVSYNLTAYRDFWWYEGHKRFCIVWNFSGIDDDIIVFASFEHSDTIWGWRHDYWFMGGGGVSGSELSYWWYDHDQEYDFYRTDLHFNPSYVEVYVYLIDNDLRIEVLNVEYGMTPVIVWNQTYGVGAGWNSSVVIRENVYHWGAGVFSFNLTDVVYDTSPYSPSVPECDEIGGLGITIWDYWDRLIGALDKVTPQWLDNYIFQFLGWADAFAGFIVPLWNMIFDLLPLVPFFLAFYIIDAITLSVYRGSFTPLGVCFLTLFNAVRGIVSAIVSIAHAVYSFIHFW